MDIITYGLLNKKKANIDSPHFTGEPTAPTPQYPDDSEPINMDLVKAIAECPSYQYKAFNRNGLISTGIIAQDLVENCKKYNVDPLKYELLDMEEFIDGDPTLYYHIEYDQLLYFKTLYLENKIKELEEKLCNLHKD